LPTLRILIQVVEGGAREGGEREIEIPDEMDRAGLIERVIMAAGDEAEEFFRQKRKERQWKNLN
jgi:hypothetical protein